MSFRQNIGVWNLPDNLDAPAGLEVAFFRHLYRVPNKGIYSAQRACLRGYNHSR
jgi:hypothetical protein